MDKPSGEHRSEWQGPRVSEVGAWVSGLAAVRKIVAQVLAEVDRGSKLESPRRGRAPVKGTTLRREPREATASCSAYYSMWLPALLSRREARAEPAGVGFTLPETISLTVAGFPYSRSLALVSESSEAPSIDAPAKAPEVRE